MAAPKGNKYAKGNKGGGRKTRYKQEYLGIAYDLALLGFTDKEMADAFEVSENTLNAWKKRYKEFSCVLKKGKAEADAKIAKSLFRRALGYEHPDVHISNFQGEITKTEITKHYPPDTAAAIFWLKNRQPDKWRDKKELDAEIKTNDLEHKSDEELQAIIDEED